MLFFFYNLKQIWQKCQDKTELADVQAFVIILGMPGIVQIRRRDTREQHGREEEQEHGAPSFLLQGPRPQGNLESICHKTLDHGVLSHLDSMCAALARRCSQGPKVV